MAIDQRDYLEERNRQLYNLPDREKDRRLADFRERLDDASGIVLKQRVRTNTGSYHVPVWVVAVAVALAFAGYRWLSAERQRPVTLQAAAQPAPAPAARPEPAPAPVPPVRPANSLADVKERYWAHFFAPGPDCRAPQTALKELECTSQREQARRDFERQWASKIRSGWRPAELRP